MQDTIHHPSKKPTNLIFNLGESNRPPTSEVLIFASVLRDEFKSATPLSVFASFAFFFAAKIQPVQKMFPPQKKTKAHHRRKGAGRMKKSQDSLTRYAYYPAVTRLIREN